MKKYLKVLIVSLFICIMFLFTSCVTVDEGEYIYVTDMVKDVVKVKKNPQKVACVSRTTYDLLAAFGLKDVIDGGYKSLYDNPWLSFIVDGAEDDYHYEYEESYETFILRGVDLVFAPEKYIAEDLREHGINAICISLYGNPTFDEYVYFFADLITQLWDSPDVLAKAKKWKQDVKDAISFISQTKEEMPSLFYVRGDKMKGIGYTDTSMSFSEYAFKMLGFKTAGSKLNTNKPSIEEIVKYNPDVFVIGGIFQHKLKEELYNDEVLKNLPAVKNDKVYNIPFGITMFEQLSITTPIFFYDMYLKLVDPIAEINISEMIKDTFKYYFNKELTDLQINYMLNGLSPDGKRLA